MELSWGDLATTTGEKSGRKHDCGLCYAVTNSRLWSSNSRNALPTRKKISEPSKSWRKYAWKKPFFSCGALGSREKCWLMRCASGEGREAWGVTVVRMRHRGGWSNRTSKNLDDLQLPCTRTLEPNRSFLLFPFHSPIPVLVNWMLQYSHKCSIQSKQTGLNTQNTLRHLKRLTKEATKPSTKGKACQLKFHQSDEISYLLF